MDIEPLPAMLPADLLPSVLCSMPVFSAGQTVALVVALMCLVVSGFVSGSEIAFFSLTPAQCEELDDTPRGPAIRRLLGMPERLLATILIANNLVNVTIVVLCNFALGPVFGSMPALWSFVLQTVILTFLILLFGEILPKIYASNYSTRWARFAAPGINFFERLFSPLSGLLVRSSGIVKRVVSKHADPLTADELSTAVKGAELVHHYGHMYFQLAEVLEKVVDHAAFRHEIRLAQQFLPLYALSLAPHIGQEVARIQHAAYIVLRAVVDRQARIAAVHHHLHHLLECQRHVDVGDVDARCHYLGSGRVAEFYDSLQDFLAVGSFHVGDVKSRRKFVGRKRVGMFAHHTLDYSRRADSCRAAK